MFRPIIVDEATHESVAIMPKRSIGGHPLTRILDLLRVIRGLPTVIRTDNGRELFGRAMLNLLAASRGHFIKRLKRQQLIAMVNQLFQHHVDDVGEVVPSVRGGASHVSQPPPPQFAQRPNVQESARRGNVAVTRTERETGHREVVIKHPNLPAAPGA